MPRLDSTRFESTRVKNGHRVTWVLGVYIITVIQYLNAQKISKSPTDGLYFPYQVNRNGSKVDFLDNFEKSYMASMA